MYVCSAVALQASECEAKRVRLLYSAALPARYWGTARLLCCCAAGTRCPPCCQAGEPSLPALCGVACVHPGAAALSGVRGGGGPGSRLCAWWGRVQGQHLLLVVLWWARPMARGYGRVAMGLSTAHCSVLVPVGGQLTDSELVVPGGHSQVEVWPDRLGLRWTSQALCWAWSRGPRRVVMPGCRPRRSGYLDDQ